MFTTGSPFFRSGPKYAFEDHWSMLLVRGSNPPGLFTYQRRLKLSRQPVLEFGPQSHSWRHDWTVPLYFTENWQLSKVSQMVVGGQGKD